MKNVSLFVSVLLLSGSISFAQSTTTPAVEAAVSSTALLPSTKPLSDSMRQVVHKVFKRGRLYSTVGAVAGATVFGSSLGYIIGGHSDWTTGVDLTMGATAASFSVANMIQFNRRHEREVIAALERGEPLSEFVRNWVPLLSKRDKKMLLSNKDN
jgi:hypothetical protein